ncbi:MULTISPECIES: alpha/beta hydrolase [Cyanophyceae]|uniref:Alpha/beta hydrolase n=1 Tax=Leptolyngbya subtilissima DQ-A4 TaxID=2933933 RepID=A0ABV0K9N5_9CYAN|nr:alpha/beta hydrolase [Nodosilinea sp. FACHB-141]MBD2110798.1 alpha/beta hydrolase [Nodosilinea sp. FACHB-141]
MKQLPFIIQKLVFAEENLAQIVDLNDTSGVEGKIPGYFVMSSAPPNIEDAEEASERIQQQANQGIADIADHLHRMMGSSADGFAELVITVHGYNTSLHGVQAWYKNIFKYANRHDSAISRSPHRVFIGYRWPSENVALSEPKKVFEALAALPPLPRDLLLTGAICALGLLILELLNALETSTWGFLISLSLVLLLALGLLMAALVVLRLIVYFRDSYRADNFGVLDLVELLRQIDQAIVQRTADSLFPLAKTEYEQQQALLKAREYWAQRSRNKVKLSFIGHSMGGFVVTNVVRILSDVFDMRSVNKQPPSDVGDVYRLERLILASPDIPVLTIVSSRANFLSSSLRRFSESYLFCNEGDIALRIASTTANYIAFPSRTQARGYRLGNVALQNKTGSIDDYGLVNLAALDRDFPVNLSVGEAIAQSSQKVMENLFLTYERFQARGVVTLGDLFEVQSKRDSQRATVADFFTYFDCTDYTDLKFDLQNNSCSIRPTGLLTRALGRSALLPWDYLMLTLDYGTGKRDVHGGYFEGQFSQQLLYRLAFLGFSGYLDTLDRDRQVALSQLHIDCQKFKIQGYLSPMRYRVSVQGGSVDGTKTDMLDAIRTPRQESGRGGTLASGRVRG